jgi:hypothetical protein
MPDEPPSALKPETEKWFHAVCQRFALESHQKRLLAAAGAEWDRAEQARAIVDALGMTFTDTKGHPRPRPEISIERNSRIAFCRLLREVGTVADAGTPETYSRPPRKFVVTNGRRRMKAPGSGW